MGRKADTNFLEKLNIRNGKFKLVSEYVNQKTDIIVSDELGIEYKTKPNDLLRGTNPSLKSAINPSKGFEIKAKIVHKDRYDYSLVNYKNSRATVCIICKKHGEFNQKPIDHLRGSGCPKCGLNNTVNYPFAKDKWASGFTDLCFFTEVLYSHLKPPLVFILPLKQCEILLLSMLNSPAACCKDSHSLIISPSFVF